MAPFVGQNKHQTDEIFKSSQWFNNQANKISHLSPHAFFIRIQVTCDKSITSISSVSMRYGALQALRSVTVSGLNQTSAIS
jgi:hypothetical protein